MEARSAVAKVGKYATSESGDSLEMIERPAGGLSFVLVDGQSSGKAAKAVANVVARKAIVHGRVQGVWYRASTAERAAGLGVRGHARNLPDGTVEVDSFGAA